MHNPPDKNKNPSYSLQLTLCYTHVTKVFSRITVHCLIFHDTHNGILTEVVVFLWNSEKYIKDSNLKILVPFRATFLYICYMLIGSTTDKTRKVALTFLCVLYTGIVKLFINIG